jgi:hypothetical protein
VNLPSCTSCNLAFGTVSVTGGSGGIVATGSGALSVTGGSITSVTGNAINLQFTGTAAGSVSLQGLTTSGSGSGGTIRLAMSSNVTTSGLKVTTTTGRAVDVNGCTTCALGFESVSSNGAPSGISLTTHTGSFSVTGTGSAGSGGTIAASTGKGITLLNAQSVSLARINVTGSADDGLNGANVAGLTLTGVSFANNGAAGGADAATIDEGVELDNVSGAVTFDGVSVTGSAHNAVHIDNAMGTISALTVTNSTFTGNRSSMTTANGFLLEVRGTSQLTTASLSGSTFAEHYSNGLKAVAYDTSTVGAFTVSGNTFTNNNIAAEVNQFQAANLTFSLSNNTSITGSQSHAIVVGSSGASTGGTLRGHIDGNTIGASASVNSGSVFGNGIRLIVQAQTRGIVTVNNNTIRQTPLGRGIEITGNSLGGTAPGGLDVTVKNNDVNPQDTSGFPLAAIFLEAQNITGAGIIRADIQGNIIPTTGTSTDTGAKFLYFNREATATASLFDSGAASANATAELDSTHAADATQVGAEAGVTLTTTAVVLP